MNVVIYSHAFCIAYILRVDYVAYRKASETFAGLNAASAQSTVTLPQLAHLLAQKAFDVRSAASQLAAGDSSGVARLGSAGTLTLRAVVE